MEEGWRSGDTLSGFVVKNRSSSGCLIVRKKDGAGDGVGPSGFRNKVFDSKENKKRHRVEFSESGSSDELPLLARCRLEPETMWVCNGLSGFDKGSDAGRKIKCREEGVRRDEIGLVGRESREEFSERKRDRLDVFEFDGYDRIDMEMSRRKRMDDGGMEGRKFLGLMMAGRSKIGRGYETGSSRHDGVDRRKNSFFERSGGLSWGDGARLPISTLRDKHDSDEPIRVQGKNGVLKVMVNKKKAGSDRSLNMYDCLEAAVDKKGPDIEDPIKRNVLVHSPYSEPKIVEKVNSFSGTMKSPLSLPKTSLAKKRKISKQDLEQKNMPVKLENVEALNQTKKLMSSKNCKVRGNDSEHGDTSLKLGQKSLEAHKTVKGTGKGGEKSPSNEPQSMKLREGKVKRATGTEKQKLREKIRQMLLDAGWTIDYRPRRNRDYLDAVYINPTGTAYWSIIKAYDALLKQLNEDEDDAKSGDDYSNFTPLPDELLSQLTRKTKKKIEKEMKKKKRNDSNSQNVTATPVRKSSSSRHDEESMDSSSHEEKLSSFIKLGGKSLKSRTNGNICSAGANSKDQNSAHDSCEKPSSGSISHRGTKSRKHGRFMLLVRNSMEGQDSETDGFIPYTGKRTLLSWLIDCGTAQLSQKVLYMNRRRTKVMLEGWVTRDGIHCGCCSKILTVSKFEIHAGNKLRQPFQNICLESGVSLLECLVDAWNRQESGEQIGFNTVDTDGDDPNDDSCGLCGDGGDLICCDGCPSTFHLSCLDIEMLPPGDWHCPNCTCKFCGVASEKLVQRDDTTISPVLTCSLCAKKYHKICILEKDDPLVGADNSFSCFCGRKCRELFEQLQRSLGVKHELEAGFSWSLIHRTDADLETALVGLSQRVECNAKLAVALSVMDECFLPIVDGRSGINLIRNVLYNCRSNFNRLNYGGFYAAILERGDEVISAASIRFHGTRLAEMPFIGTRHIYRHQGMCRRLFSAIELALSSFKVEKLIIPAISELMHTWTEVFGFAALDKSLKQELKSMNMLVFPGVDMLQKQLFELEKNDGNKSISTGTKAVEMQCSQPIKSEIATDPVDSSDEDDHHENANAELATAYSDSERLDIPMNGTSLMSSSLDASHDGECAESLHDGECAESLRETENRDPGSDQKLNESAVANRYCMSNASQDVKEVDGETKSHSIVIGDDHSQVQSNVTVDDLGPQCPGVHLDDVLVMNGSPDVSHERDNPILLEGNVNADSVPGGLLLPSDSRQKDSIMADMDGVGHDQRKPELVSLANEHCQSSKLDDIDGGAVSSLNSFFSCGTKISTTTTKGKIFDHEMMEQCNELVQHGESPHNTNASLNALEMETNLVLVSVDKSIYKSFKECDFQDAQLENRVSCVDALSFPDEAPAENLAMDIDETNSVALSRLHAADNSNSCM